MNKNKIIQYIDSLLNSSIILDEKINILLEIQKYINKNLNFLEERKNKLLLEEYIKKHKTNQSDDFYSLECKYEINRDFQNVFVSMLNKVNIDGYGLFEGDVPSNIKKEYKETFDIGGYENDTFYIRPYNWDGISCEDCNCGLDDNLEDLELNKYKYGFHSKDCMRWNTNFYYKPTDLKIEWYKYALRSAYSNKILEEDEIILILKDCIKSIDLDKNI